MAALDVTVTLKAATEVRAAVRPGHPMAVAYDAKKDGAYHPCRQENNAFIPIVSESLGVLHPAATAEFRKTGSHVVRHTGAPRREDCVFALRCHALIYEASSRPAGLNHSVSYSPMFVFQSVFTPGWPRPVPPRWRSRERWREVEMVAPLPVGSSR